MKDALLTEIRHTSRIVVKTNRYLDRVEAAHCGLSPHRAARIIDQIERLADRLGSAAVRVEVGHAAEDVLPQLAALVTRFNRLSRAVA